MTFAVDSLMSVDAIPAAVLRVAEEAYNLNKKGIDALTANDLPVAQESFEKAMSILPGYTDAENNLGVTWFRRGNMGKAEQIWANLTNANPHYTLGFHNRGVAAFYERSYDVAQSFFDKALGLNKQFIDSYVYSGRVSLALGNTSQALEKFKRAIAINPKHPGAFGYYAYALVAAKDTVKAIALLRERPDHTGALEMLGTILAAKGDVKEATEVLRKAVNRGASAETYLTLATVLLDAHDCSQALAMVKEYFAHAPVPSASAYINASVAAGECKENALAESYLTEGVKRFPTDPFIRYNLGKLYFIRNALDAAESQWKVLSDSMYDPELYYLRSTIAVAHNRLTDAETMVRKSIRLDKSSKSLLLLGNILIAQNKKDAGKEAFKEVLALDPSNGNATLNLALLDKGGANAESALLKAKADLASCSGSCGRQALTLSILYAYQKKYPEAIATLEKIPVKERNVSVCKALGVYYKEAGQWANAIATLEKARIDGGIKDASLLFDLASLYSTTGHYERAIDLFGMVEKDPGIESYKLQYSWGYAILQQGRLDEALMHLEKSLKSKETPSALGLVAYIYNKQGNAAKASELWQKNLRDDPDNSVVLVNLGLAQQQSGKLSEALDYFKKAAQAKNADAAVYINIGSVLDLMGKNADAAKAYEKALVSSRRDCAAYNLYVHSVKNSDKSMQASMQKILTAEFPKSLYASRIAAESAIERGDTAAAQAALMRIPDKEKDDADWLLLARIAAESGDDAKAQEILNTVSTDSDVAREKNRLLGQAAFTAKKYGDAFKIWSANPDTSIAIRFNMCVAALNATMPDSARFYTKKLLAEKGLSGDIIQKLYQISLNASTLLKDWVAVAEVSQDIVKQTPRNATAWYNGAVAYYNLGNVEKSYEMYTRAQSIDSKIVNKDIENRYAASRKPTTEIRDTVADPFDIDYNKAVSLQSLGKNKAALALYKKIVAASPTYFRAWNNIGAIYAAEGKLEEAVECYLKALAQTHELPEAYANLALVYVALGQKDDARKCIADGLQYNPGNEVLVKVSKMVE